MLQAPATTLNLQERKLHELRLLKAKRRLQLQDSFYEFVKDAFDVLHPGETIEDNWHIEYVCGRIQYHMERVIAGKSKERNICINIPPRSLKSIICSIALPAWTWTRSQRVKFIGSTHSGTLSTDHSVKCRRIIESRWYQNYWGDEVKLADDQNAKTKFENTHQGVRISTSTGGSITGEGADVILWDDPMDPKKSVSTTERKKANDHYKILRTRLNDQSRGLIILLMQRLHEDDPTGAIVAREPEKWEHIVIPAQQSENCKPKELLQFYEQGNFFNERFSTKVLTDLLGDMSSYEYAGQYQQRPSPEEGGIIKKSWFKKITWEAFVLLTNKRDIVWHFFLDTAYTADTSNDPTAVISCCTIDNKLYIRIVQSKYLEFPELIKFIQSFVNSNGYTPRSRIYIEPKASGKSIVQQLRRETMLNVVEDESPREDKVTRVNAVTGAMQAERVVLIEDSWNDSYLSQLGLFPNGTHDDEVDITVAAIKKLLQKQSTGTVKATI